MGFSTRWVSTAVENLTSRLNSYGKSEPIWKQRDIDWNPLERLNIGEPDMVDHWNNCGLSNRIVFDRGQIRPAGKIDFKNAFQY